MMEIREKYRKETGNDVYTPDDLGLCQSSTCGQFTNEYVEYLESLVKKSSDIHNVSGKCVDCKMFQDDKLRAKEKWMRYMCRVDCNYITDPNNFTCEDFIKK